MKKETWKNQAGVTLKFAISATLFIEVQKINFHKGKSSFLQFFDFFKEKLVLASDQNKKEKEEKTLEETNKIDEKENEENNTKLKWKTCKTS